MKNLLTVTILFFSLFHLFSCGPNVAEQAQIQQHRDDSIKSVAEKKYATEAELKNENEALNNLHKTLENQTANLEAEKDRMNKIKEWHLGRSTDECKSSA